MSLGGPELLVVLLIVLLLFGASRLPKLAKSLGEASKEFKRGVGEGKDASSPEPGPASGTTASDGDEKITMTKAELDALLAEREAQARKDDTRPS
jgi:sec-independent protein translocase protein TatA